MSLLNNITILKPGMLAKTATTDKWQSSKYWNRNNMDWEVIPSHSPILIIYINEQKVDFLYEESIFSIHNCYNDEQGNPYWCDPL